MGLKIQGYHFPKKMHKKLNFVFKKILKLKKTPTEKYNVKRYSITDGSSKKHTLQK